MTLQYYCAIFTRFNIINRMVAEVGSALMFRFLAPYPPSAAQILNAVTALPDGQQQFNP